MTGSEMTPTESLYRQPSSQLSIASTLKAPQSLSQTKSASRDDTEEPVLLKSVFVEGTGWASQVGEYQ